MKRPWQVYLLYGKGEQRGYFVGTYESYDNAVLALRDKDGYYLIRNRDADEKYRLAGGGS